MGAVKVTDLFTDYEEGSCMVEGVTTEGRAREVAMKHRPMANSVVESAEEGWWRWVKCDPGAEYDFYYVRSLPLAHGAFRAWLIVFKESDE